MGNRQSRWDSLRCCWRWRSGNTRRTIASPLRVSQRRLGVLAACSCFRMCVADGDQQFTAPEQRLAADMRAVAAEVSLNGIDAPQVDVLVDGRPMGTSSLSSWRFEGFLNPERYMDGKMGLRTMRGPWTETIGDVRGALRWAQANASKLRASVARKRARFGFGRAWEPGQALPIHHFRDVVFDATSWLQKLEAVGVRLSASFINIGAADGVGDDPLFPYAVDIRKRGLKGPRLAVEANHDLCSRHRQNLPEVTLLCTLINTQNTKSLITSAFATQESRLELDVLKLDIDSFEASVLEECIHRVGLRPKLIFVEINAGVPPPLQYALLDSPQLRSKYPQMDLVLGPARSPLEINMPIAGVSLSYLVRRLSPEYKLLELGSPDAVFARADILDRLGRQPLDEFKAFESAWVDVHGFSRHQVRRWYFELDEIQALGEIHDYLTTWMDKHIGVLLPYVLSV